METVPETQEQINKEIKQDNTCADLPVISTDVFDEPETTIEKEEIPSNASKEQINSITNEIDPVAKLKQLKELLDSGLISKKEYEEARKKYVAML